MSISENIKPNYTTAVGIAILFIGVTIFLIPMFWTVKETIEWYVPTLFCVGGILLWLAPDKLIGIVSKAGDKAADKL
jgi:hypothetical protein